MTEQRAAELRTTFAQIALKLQRALIEATGTNYMEISISDRANFDAPAVRAPAPLLGIDLSGLPAYIFNHGVDRRTVLDLWDPAFAAALIKGDDTRVASRLRVALPNVRLHGTPVERATQFLHIASMSAEDCRADFRPGRTQIWTRTSQGDVAVGFDRDLVRWVTRDGAQGQRCVTWVRPKSGNALSVGNRLQSRPATGGVYKVLMAALPDLADQIQYVFSAAVTAGAEYEDILTSPFDWVLNRDAFDTIDDVWKQATRIVETATHSPLLELYRLLRVRVGYTVFEKSLGKPHRDPGEYRPSTRARHLRALAELQRSTSSTSSPVTAVNELLQLQVLLGGSNHV
jgi:hypothetical protein